MKLGDIIRFIVGCRNGDFKNSVGVFILYMEELIVFQPLGVIDDGNLHPFAPFVDLDVADLRVLVFDAGHKGRVLVVMCHIALVSTDYSSLFFFDLTVFNANEGAVCDNNLYRNVVCGFDFGHVDYLARLLGVNVDQTLRFGEDVVL